MYHPPGTRLALLLALILLLAVAAACDSTPSPPTPIPTALPSPTIVAPTLAPTVMLTAAPTNTPVVALSPTPAATGTAPPIYDARAERITVQSQTLGVPKSFYVYTPPGYDPAGAARLPVLYLLRGHEREWINKREDGTRGGHNVIDVYEELLAQKAVGPLLLVFPGISSDDNSVPGMLTNFRAPTLTTASGIGTGRFEDYFIQELIPYVDSHYATIASKAGRGVDGFSLGGTMSTKIAAGHPDLFATVGAFDGLYFYARPDCTAVDTERDSVFGYLMFNPIFGRPPDPVYGAANNAPNLVCNGTPAALQSLHWFIQYGPESAEPNDSNYYRGVHLVEQLTAKGVKNEIEPILLGNHRWGTADAHLRLTLPLHWTVLGATP